MKLARLCRHADELGFSPQPSVRWLAPVELCRTAVKVVLSSIFANYSDKREIQASLPAATVECLVGDGRELWIDFVADLGDGFDATYTVASLIANEKLDVDPADGPIPHVLPRASLLVLGGDEVYPTASARAYEDRMTGPYRAALPTADQPRPMLVALPGNHDWYDGLTSFLRIFTQGSDVGGWRTVQNRSYFALQLPHRWWLIGLDSQLGAYIDEPQLRFFREHVTANLRPGDAVIVCAAAPTWVKAETDDVEAFNAMHYFDRQIIQCRPDPQTGQPTPTGASVRLWITGDKHHYARYAEPSPDPAAARQMVTCGMGGAYLSATHDLPTTLHIPQANSRMREKEPSAEFTLRTRYPDERLSRLLSWGVLSPTARGLPFRNPGFWPLVGILHMIVFIALIPLLGLLEGSSPIGAVRDGSPLAALGLGLWLLIVTAVVVLAYSLKPVLTLRAPRTPPSPVIAFLFQLCVAIGGLAVATAMPWPDSWPGWVVLTICLACTGVLTGLVGCFAFAAYIRLAGTGVAADWQMSAQSIEDHKGFVRMHIGADGNLTLYPILIDKVCHDWALAPDADGRKRPVPAEPLRRPRLIEPPILVGRNGKAP